MAAPAVKTDGAEAFLSAFPEPSGEASWAREARRRAVERFRQQGVPVRRDEYWKYTDPTGLTVLPAREAAVLDTDEAPVFDVLDSLKIVFVDGEFSAELSDDFSLENVEIERLEDVLKLDIHWARDLFGVLEGNGQTPVARPLAVLNTARATDGVVIRVTGKVAKPISLRYLHRSPSSDAQIRHLVKVEAGAEATILEAGPAAARFNNVMEIEVAPTASLHHVRAQGRDHERQAVTGLFARLGEESTFKSFTLSVNGRMTRNECVLEFTGDNAVAHVAGACAGDDDFHHDDTVFITHDGLNCESRQVFKKVLRSGATGVFQGKILVKEGAQKTDGYQISQGLLLDDDSNFLAKPELEIYADDVVCSHGSTCGAVDETSLFYLRSRGISRAAAEELLVLAFLDEAIVEIEDDVLADEIRDRLAGWLARRRA